MGKASQEGLNIALLYNVGIHNDEQFFYCDCQLITLGNHSGEEFSLSDLKIYICCF